MDLTPPRGGHDSYRRPWTAPSLPQAAQHVSDALSGHPDGSPHLRFRLALLPQLQDLRVSTGSGGGRLDVMLLHSLAASLRQTRVALHARPAPDGPAQRRG